MWDAVISWRPVVAGNTKYQILKGDDEENRINRASTDAGHGWM